MEQPLPPLRERGLFFRRAGSGQIDSSGESYPVCTNANVLLPHPEAAVWPRVDPPDKSGGKTGASLLTAALDDVASGGSGHTGKESEPAFTAAVGGLESSFHFLFVLFFYCYTVFKITCGRPVRQIFCDTILCRFLKIAPIY